MMWFEAGYIFNWSISSHCRQQGTNCLTGFDHFLELAFKGLNIIALELTLCRTTSFRSYCADCKQVRLWNLWGTLTWPGLISNSIGIFVSFVLENSGRAKLYPHTKRRFHNNSYYEIFKKLTERLFFRLQLCRCL